MLRKLSLLMDIIAELGKAHMVCAKDDVITIIGAEKDGTRFELVLKTCEEAV